MTVLVILFFFLMLGLPAGSTLVPYPTLFRSSDERLRQAVRRDGGVVALALGILVFIITQLPGARATTPPSRRDRKSTRLNSSHPSNSYAVFCLKKNKLHNHTSLMRITQLPHF